MAPPLLVAAEGGAWSGRLALEEEGARRWWWWFLLLFDDDDDGDDEDAAPKTPPPVDPPGRRTSASAGTGILCRAIACVMTEGERKLQRAEAAKEQGSEREGKNQ